ncbi:glycosyltransferase family 9 protein [Collimonas pratensis]|uniref:Glycosyltransferase 9 family protein n=1 Tax=Collimonas pratensis TaxID=279113 RepID=A0ABM5Z6B8_9BURK|nr:hypothetical protein [Collimonas pratensis]AMP14655.1 glycosyltransferase 9 family protein [Collimonas pratensis]
MKLLNFQCNAIGDQISVSGMPEAVFLATGEKVAVCNDSMWVFDHNPYVTRISKEEAAAFAPEDVYFIVPDCAFQEHRDAYWKTHQAAVIASQTDFMVTYLGLAAPASRLPRLYYPATVPTPIANRVVVHTTGSDRARIGEAPFRAQNGEDHIRVMTPEVMQAIAENYQGWEMLQIGAADDVPMPGAIDLRGKLSIWETAETIGSASRFVGVNSGPMHLANAFPRVDKRIVLMEFSREYLASKSSVQPTPFRPGDIYNYVASWLDPANRHFNRFDCDIGVTHRIADI